MQESKNPLPKSENLLEMQLASWNRGEPLSLETLFGLMNEPNVELMLDLIYQDVCRREDDGEHLTSAEYSARFPQLHVDIESLFEVHRAMKRDFDLEAPEENVAGSSYSERYSHSRELGVGGLGRVFLAHDRHLGRSIAIKKLLPQYSQSRHHRERFLREATLTAKLAHPAIVPIYDMGSDEHGELYYSMKFLDGQSLDDLAVSRGPQFRWSDNRSELRRLVNYLVSVCRGVSHAHERGILHRDIKPANILVGDQDDALLVDWGIAGFKQPAELNSPLHETAVSCDEEQSTQIGKTKTSPGKKTNSSSDRLTVAGMRLGTPAFMSPEQLEDPQNAIEQSDVFSLGATLYFSLKGHAPNQDATYGEWAPPKALLAICNKSLSPQLSKRYATVSDLASDLENWLAGDPISAHPEGIAKKAWRWVFWK